MKKYLLILAVALSTFYSQAQPELIFEKANTLYQQKEYSAAVAMYDSIVNEGFAHAETYYNLGNAHFRLGNLGMAILNYEKALKMNPDDEDAQHNLALANKQVIDEFNVLPTPAMQRIFGDISSVFSSSVWAYFGIGFFVLMALFASIFLYVKRQSIFIVLLIITLALGAFAEFMAFGKNQLEQQQFAILTEANSYVKSAPADAAEDLFILHEGTKVKVLDAFGEWMKIKLPDGKIGWINVAGLSVI